MGSQTSRTYPDKRTLSSEDSRPDRHGHTLKGVSGSLSCPATEVGEGRRDGGGARDSPNARRMLGECSENVRHRRARTRAPARARGYR
jgi:hypothetical protein